jgi:hypothetical protein
MYYVFATQAHDYKPAFGGLWADVLEVQQPDYWGWHDLDEIFGSFDSFTPLMMQHDIIGACDGRSCGPFMLFKHSSKERFATVYAHAPQYLTKLALRKHDMLDEEGCCGGQPDDHSHASWMIAHGFRGQYERDPVVFMALLQNEAGWAVQKADGDSHLKYADTFLDSPTGLSMWQDGRMVNIGDHSRELLLFHRTLPSAQGQHLKPESWKTPADLTLTLERMAEFGFLLPGFVPLKWDAEGFGGEGDTFDGWRKDAEGDRKYSTYTKAPNTPPDCPKFLPFILNRQMGC